MATMVVRGSSPLASSSASGSRNKRKFRAEPPPIDPSTLTPLPQAAEYAGYEFFPALENPSLEFLHGMCDMCRAPYGPPREEEVELEEFRDTDWSDLTETQLEEIILINLDTIFKSAIKIIASYGYTEAVAANAVLRPGICYGYKDTVSNVVENALAFLRSGQEVDSSLRVNLAEDLQKFEKSVLVEMVNVLRDVRPFFSSGDAMWCLLICDMNVTHACAVDGDPLNVLRNGDASCNSTLSQIDLQPNLSISTSQMTLKFNAPPLNKLNTSSPYPRMAPQTRMPAVMGIPNLPCGKFCASSIGHSTVPSFNVGKEDPSRTFDRVGELSCSTISQAFPLDEKRNVGRKGHVGITKRESTLRQKSIHFEKSYRAFGSKAALRAGKHSGIGNLVLDRKCKAVSVSAGVNVKSASLRLSKVPGTTVTHESTNLNLSLSDDPSVSPSYNIETPSNLSPLPLANTELSLSLSSTSNIGVTTKPNCSVESATCSNYVAIPSDKTCGYWVPHDKKDEILVKLVPRVRELQVQLQEWTEWAQQKVMQAARRLNKDKAELQSLRQEKEEVSRLEKEKQNLEDSTRKKLIEMETALSKASDQVECTNAAAHRLEVENSGWRRAMEAAKIRASESAASCQEVLRREMEAQRKFQSWEREKALLQEELAAEKRKSTKLHMELKQASEFQDQLQARWKLEKAMKDEALMQANSVRKEREQIETSGRGKENVMRLTAETDTQRYKADIRRLEEQIAQLRLKTDSSKIAALRQGADVSYASLHSDGKKDGLSHVLVNIIDTLEFGAEAVQRDRECVMCLTEEMSVVFLPCAHQVVCTKCNELHEKQGMKDCPSCRTPIQRRISVRSADS